MTDRLITADASKISGREFFDAVFGKRRTPEEQAERERLAREHQSAIQATFSLSLFEGIEERARLNAEFDALVKAGKTEVMILPDSLGEQVARDLKFTIELNDRRAA